MTTCYQTLRLSMDYLAPTTLVAVITDTATHRQGSALAIDIRNAAWAALMANAGAEEAIELIMGAGISAEDVEDAS